MSSSTSTSLTLRALLKTAAGRLGLGVRGRPVAGLTAAAKSLFIAAAGGREHVVVIAPTDADVEQLTSDVRFFLSALEGVSDAEAASVVLPLPSHEIDPYRGLSPHFDIASRRARTLHALATGTARIAIASGAALLPRLSAPARLEAIGLTLRPDDEISPTDLADRLAAAGYAREDPTDTAGEFSARGGVVDFFPAGAKFPIRVEFIGDNIESLRMYDPGTQRSIEPVDQAHIEPLLEIAGDRATTIVDYFDRARPAVLVSEPDEVKAAIVKLRDQIDASYAEAIRKNQKAAEPASLVVGWDELASLMDGATRLETLALGTEDDVRHIATQPAMEFAGRVPDWVAELRNARQSGETVIFVANSQGRADRVIEMLADYQVPAAPIDRGEDSHAGAVLVAVGRLSKGFRLPDAALQLWAETDVFDEDRVTHERRRSAARTFLSDFRDLKIGDLVVHVDNGIGVFVGLKRIDVGLESQEFMELRYAGDDKLFVPVERLDLVQKYAGASRPALDKLGGTSWEKAKTRVKKAMRDMAEELLKLYASRKALPGFVFSPDSHWQQEFEDAFEWELTIDQRNAVADIKKDMESPTP
ncbi:MAG TPA: CarD family transcriptional regulator, partial [Vicinamibacterales bacterium]|nr:CarD family transcriptional regulator [Vicinamibacterales bacterium]